MPQNKKRTKKEDEFDPAGLGLVYTSLHDRLSRADTSNMQFPKVLDNHDFYHFVKVFKYDEFLRVLDEYYTTNKFKLLSREDMNAFWYQFLLFTYKEWDGRQWAKRYRIEDSTINYVKAKKLLFKEGCSQMFNNKAENMWVARAKANPDRDCKAAPPDSDDDRIEVYRSEFRHFLLDPMNHDKGIFHIYEIEYWVQKLYASETQQRNVLNYLQGSGWVDKKREEEALKEAAEEMKEGSGTLDLEDLHVSENFEMDDEKKNALQISKDTDMDDTMEDAF